MTSNPANRVVEATSSHTLSRYHIGKKSKEILATRDITGFTRLVTMLCYGKDKTEEGPPYSKLLYESFTKNFPNTIVSKLLQLYRFAPVSAKIRSFALNLLDSLLIDLDESRVGLKTEYFIQYQTHLNSCFFQRETSDHDFKLLSSIVSRVAVEIFIGCNPWEELCFYILSLNENKKAFLIFSQLPTLLDEDFLMPLLLEKRIDVKIVNGLLLNNQDCDEEEWCLALEAGFSLILHLVNLKMKNMVWDLVYVIVKSVWEMVNVRRRGTVVRQGFVRIIKKVRKEALRFDEAEFEVVSRLASMLMTIHGAGKITEMTAKKIHEVSERHYTCARCGSLLL